MQAVVGEDDRLATLDVNVFSRPPFPSSYLPEPLVHSSGSREGRLHPVPHGSGRWALGSHGSVGRYISTDQCRRFCAITAVGRAAWAGRVGAVGAHLQFL